MNPSTAHHHSPENTREVLDGWRTHEDPFYQALAEFIEQDRLEVPIENPWSPEEVEALWGENQPDEIILATGSVQKAFEAFLISRRHEVKVPFGNPIKYQEFVSRHIYNGDGALRQKIFIDYFLGIPVYAQSAASGETPANDPDEEALNKAEWLAIQYTDGKRRYIIATDAVDFADLNGDGALSAGKEGLGKPGNLSEYPAADADSSQLESFNTWYKETFFLHDGESLEDDEPILRHTIHNNAVVILDALANEETSSEVVRAWRIILETTYNKEKLRRMEVAPLKGGGGASQQFIDWDNAEEVYETLDEETRAIMAADFAENPVEAVFPVMSQIVGMPALNIFHELEKLTTRLAREGAVVFSSQDQVQ